VGLQENDFDMENETMKFEVSEEAFQPEMQCNDKTKDVKLLRLKKFKL
jgi:hypothetical protein